MSFVMTEYTDAFSITQYLQLNSHYKPTVLLTRSNARILVYLYELKRV